MSTWHLLRREQLRLSSSTSRHLLRRGQMRHLKCKSSSCVYRRHSGWGAFESSQFRVKPELQPPPSRFFLGGPPQASVRWSRRRLSIQHGAFRVCLTRYRLLALRSAVSSQQSLAGCTQPQRTTFLGRKPQKPWKTTAARPAASAGALSR